MTLVLVRDRNDSTVSQRRKTKARALRKLLSDRQWHNQLEMMAAGGMRYGARLFDLHHDTKHPVHYQRVATGLDVFEYRACSARQCTECTHPRQSVRTKLRCIEAENDRLRDRVQNLEESF